jgi:anthranilate synthase component II
MFLLIDNYDSFTYNLWHYLGELGAEVVVKRNDALTVAAALALRPQGIVISLNLVRDAGAVPILGVCLGHQAIGQVFGGRVVRAPVPMHGKLSAIRHDGTGLFAGLPNPFEATRYHSLIVDRAAWPNSLTITAETADGIVMGLQHRERPIHGVQFHPESIASVGGHQLLGNFLRLASETSIAA